MKWETFLMALIAVPILALFGGLGVLAWQIGETWDQRNTDALVTAVASICAGGAVIVGALLALIVGVPLALRAYDRGGTMRQPPQTEWRALPPARPSWTEQPPMIADKQQGTWQSAGSYDVWEDAEMAEKWGER